MRLTAEALDANGHAVAGAEFLWESSDEAVALVDAFGLVTAVGNGAATITAASGSASGTTAVTVQQVPDSVAVSPTETSLAALGDTMRLTAEALDANGYAVAGAEFLWESSDEAVALVDASGLVRGTAEGKATITASSGDARGISEITVENPDRAALVALYEATDGPNWANNENWLTDAALGDWYGVNADYRGRVIGMDLYNNRLAGSIPSELGNLARLKFLDLSDNGLSGAIPAELGNLGSLEFLTIQSNGLAGSIPPELGNLANLEWLYVNDNELSGPLPISLAALQSVERFHYQNTDLCVPASDSLRAWLDGISSHHGTGVDCNVSTLPVTIATDSLPQGRVTLEYAETLRARGGSGGGYAWSLGGDDPLPQGLELTAEGALQGIPQEAGDFEFAVRVVDSDGEEATATLDMTVCDGPLGLSVGDVRIAQPHEIGRCGLFVRAPEGSAYYRVTLGGLNASSEAILPVELVVEGISPSEAPGLRPVVVTDPRQGPAPARRTGPEGDPSPLLEIEDANHAFHLQLRQEEEEFFAQLKAEGRLAGMLQRGIEAQAARRQVQASRQTPRTFKLYDRNGGSRCGVHRTITADVIAENDHLVVWEDTAATSPVPVANVNRVIDFYSDHGADVIDRYFGGVSDVNGDGKVAILVHADIDGAIAYVWSGDMVFTELDCPTSDEMELMHVEASAFTQLEDNRFGAMGGIAHEMAHVSSLYKRVRSDVMRGEPAGVRTFNPTWIEEGRAEIAKEMTSRLSWERAGGPAMRDRVNRTIMRDGLANLRPEAYGIFQIMARVVRAFSVDPNAVTFEPLDQGHVYGSGWHFHRLLRDLAAAGVGDEQGADEAVVLALNDSLAPPGVAGIEAVTGRSIAELLADHAAALTVAGAESWLTDKATPRFATYDFPTSTEIFSNPDPPGRYPWPVTITGDDDNTADPSVPLMRSQRFTGRIGASGVRVFDFEATVEGAGAVFRVPALASITVVVARIPRPSGF